MTWFIGFITSTIVSFISWLVKKFGIKTVITTFYITIAGIIIAFILTAVTYLMSFLFSLWDMVKDVSQFYSTVPNVGGSSFGVDNQSLITSFFGLLNESGLATALETSGNLLIGLLSVYFVIQAYKIYSYAIKNIHTVISDLIKMMSA
ncbi:hypothetical protein ACKGJI_04585 [Sulfurospirillum sp. 1307]